jgi:hypothetical protein
MSNGQVKIDTINWHFLIRQIRYSECPVWFDHPSYRFPIFQFERDILPPFSNIVRIVTHQCLDGRLFNTCVLFSILIVFSLPTATR